MVKVRVHNVVFYDKGNLYAKPHLQDPLSPPTLLTLLLFPATPLATTTRCLLHLATIQ